MTKPDDDQPAAEPQDQPQPAAEVAAEPAPKAKPERKAKAAKVTKPAKVAKPAKAEKPAKVAKPARGKKAEPAAPTKEDFLAEIGKALDEIEAHMQKRKSTQPISWRHVFHGPLMPMKERIDKARNGLDRLLRGTKSRFDVWTIDWSKPGAAEAIREYLEPLVGEACWARPCSFMLWLGRFPVRVSWAGFLEPEAHIFALDPAGMFLNPDGVVRSHVVEVGGRDPAAFIRAALVTRLEAKDQQLVLLKPDAAKATRDFLADPANAWWVEQIARGPVDPVPVPSRIGGVQRALFA